MSLTTYIRLSLVSCSLVQEVLIKNISKRFGSHLAVDRANIDIKAGEMFFLLGPSGCGKTTLLRMIAGFESPSSGDLFFDSDNVTCVPPNKRGTGMVFQGYALWPHMTVFDNIAYGLKIQKKTLSEINDLVYKALDSVKLKGLEGRKPNALSGGQQQRVALARALVVRPRVLLLDEPLSNLDAGLRASMRLEIREICKKSSITTIYVTHDQKEALAIADRIALMKNGNLQQVGTPQELYNSPKNPFVASFLGETNEITGMLNGNEIESEYGTFCIDDKTDDNNNKKVTLSIRPEDIELLPYSDPRSFNSDSLILSGTIIHAIFLGDCFHYEIKIRNGILKVTSPKSTAFNKNDEVKLHINKKSIVRF